MNFKCPHVGSKVVPVFETKKSDLGNACYSCKQPGPNLWICMQPNCLQVGCSEKANDHNTQHFKFKNSHCVHMNLSSQRMWCYICEKEVFLKNGRTSMVTNGSRLTDIDEDIELNVVFPDEFAGNGNVRGLVGLQNIANTCYMNSALQALSNIKPLTYYFLDCAELVEHIVEMGTWRNKSKLAKSYLQLMRDIWSAKNGKDFVAPRGILYGIRNVHPIFRGFQQHDTQEFLRCFMDQLHEELKEQPSPLPKTGYRSVNSGISHNYSIQYQQNAAKEDNQSRDSQSDSSSHSEGEYETCDSGVSEQSSLFEDINSREVISGGNADSVRLARERPTWAKVARRDKGYPVEVVLMNEHRSIISDVFDGKILSSVQCLTCDRISTREETFQDLSLPIPNRDHLNVLHQTHIAQGCAFSYGPRASGHAGGELVKSDDWISWIWKLLRSWLWGPPITLHDCMASFFSADELKGDNMYSCEKCNKLRTGVKFSRILDLPEALCIHLKRFRHDLSYSSKISSYINFPLECFDMSPYLHKECKSNVALYNLVSVICHYGTVGGGHYTCFAKNEFTNKWYEFDDHQVTEVPSDTVQNCQAYVLFYRKRNTHMDLIRAEARDISNLNPTHGSDIRFYVSREWLTRFNTFAEPGPINNWNILCPHGGLPPTKIEVMNKIAIPISQELWDYFYEKFGGGPAINMLFECELCKRTADFLTRRQNYELTIFTKYNDLDNTNAIYAISMPWLRKWQLFARSLTDKEPGPITNLSILGTESLAGTIRNVKAGSDYAQINESLWKFLHGIYGGGPEIIFREITDGQLMKDCEYGRNLEKSKAHLDTNYNFDQNINEKIQLGEENIEKDMPKEVDIFGSGTIDCDKSFINGEISTKKFTKRNSKQQKNISAVTKKSSILFDYNINKRVKRRRSCLKNVYFGPNASYLRYKN